MDPEIAQQLNEQFREMSDILSQQNATMAAMLKAQQEQMNAARQASSAIKQDTNTTNQRSAATGELTKKQQAYAQAEEQRVQKANETIAKFNKAIDFTTGAFMSLGTAIMDSTHNFQKYNTIIGGVGDAAFDLGRNFGILGTVIGGVVKGATELLEYQLEQADSLLKFNDTVSKMGAANSFTTNEIFEMGNKAGFAAKDLDKLTGPMQKLGSSFKSMGQGAEDSTRRFMEMANVGSDVRQEFQRLGYSQEQLVEALAGYVELMSNAGLSIRSFSSALGTLQKVSTEYVKNLTVLSEISGINAEEQQKQMSDAAAEKSFQLYLIEMNKKIAAASPEEQKRLSEQVANTMAAKAMITATQGKEAGLGYGQAVAGVPVTKGLGTLALLDTEEENRRLAEASIENKLTAEMIAKAQDSINKKYIEKFGEGGDYRVAGAVSDEFLELVGGLGPLMRNVQLQNYDEEKARKEIEAKLAANSPFNPDGTPKTPTGPSATDQLVLARQQLTESEITLRTGFDELAKKIGIMTTAAIAASVALGGLAAMALLRGRGAAAAARGAAGAARGGAGLAAGAAMAGGLPKTPDIFLPEHMRSSPLPGAGAAGEAAAGASKLGKLGGLAKGAGRLLGTLAWPLTVGMSLYDAYQGFNADSNASFGGKMLNAGKSALSGLTFGLLGSSPEEIAANAGKGAAPGQGTDASSMSGIFAESVANFGSMVASFGTNMGSFAELIGAFATSVTAFSTAISSSLSNRDRLSRRQSNLETVLGNTLLDSDDSLSPLELFQLSIENLTTRLDYMREAEIKRHNFNEVSMKEFRKGLEDAAKKLKDIAGTGGDTNTPSPGSPTMYGGDMDRILGTIRAKESGGGNPAGDYTAKNPNSSASGAYQFIDSTWQSLTKKYGIGQEYKSARDAPAHIQDEIAKRHVEEILKQSGGDVSKVPTAWHTGNIQGKSNAVSASEVAAYDRDWMNKYNSLEGYGAGGKVDAAGKPAGEGDQSIVALGKQLQSQGLVISGHTKFGGRPAKGKHADNSRHYRDLAIDINAPGGITEANDPVWKEKFNDLAVQIQRAGFAVKWNDDANHKNHIHASVGAPEGSVVKAAKGGIFDGPTSGYPAELHGSEMVAPLSTDSVLMKLAKTPAETEGVTNVVKPTNNIERESIQKLINVNSEMMESMLDRLSEMVEAINDGNDTRQKILKNSQV